MDLENRLWTRTTGNAQTRTVITKPLFVRQLEREGRVPFTTLPTPLIGTGHYDKDGNEIFVHETPWWVDGEPQRAHQRKRSRRKSSGKKKRVGGIIR